MKCLLTGATGFIGSWMAERLVREGLEVCCLVRPESDLRWLRGLPIEYRHGSLFEPQALRTALRDVEGVLHLAGITRALRRSDYYRVNAAGTEELLKAIRDAAPRVKKILHISSQAAAGPAPHGAPLDETSPPNPITDYGRSKLASEEIARRFMSSLPITVLRPPVIFGPRDKSGLALFRSAARGYRISVKGCDPAFSPLYVEDLVEAALCALRSEASTGEIYFVTGEETLRASQLVTLIAELMGGETREAALPYPLAYAAVSLLEVRARLIGKPNKLNHAKLKELTQPYWTASNAKIERELGFVPRFALAQGLRITLDWYREAGWLERGAAA